MGGILLACPTRGRVWYETTMSLLEILPDVEDFLFGMNKISVMEARNDIMRAFLEDDFEFLLMIDDDVLPPPGVALKLREGFADKKTGIVAAPCPLVRPGLPVLPNIYRIAGENDIAIDISAGIAPKRRLQKVDAVGFGCVMLRRSLVEKLPTVELRYREDGTVWAGEDTDYCLRAREAGFSVKVDMDSMCDHVLELHGGAVATTYNQLLLSKAS